MKYTVPDLLDEIKAKYEALDCKPTVTYRLVLQSYSGDSPVCDIDQNYVMEYDDLCGRLFDLDMRGWSVVNFHVVDIREEMDKYAFTYPGLLKIVIEMEQSPEWQKAALQ